MQEQPVQILVTLPEWPSEVAMRADPCGRGLGMLTGLGIWSNGGRGERHVWLLSVLTATVREDATRIIFPGRGAYLAGNRDRRDPADTPSVGGARFVGSRSRGTPQSRRLLPFSFAVPTTLFSLLSTLASHTLLLFRSGRGGQDRRPSKVQRNRCRRREP